MKNKKETAEYLVERFRNTQNSKPYVRLDFVNGKVKYKWYKSYEAAKNGAKMTRRIHSMCIVSKDDCVFLDEV